MSYRIRNARFEVIAEGVSLEEAAKIAGIGIHAEAVQEQLATFGVAAVGCLRIEAIPTR